MGFIEIEAFFLRNRFVPEVKPSGKPSWNDKGSFPIQKSLQEAIYTGWLQKHTGTRTLYGYHTLGIK